MNHRAKLWQSIILFLLIVLTITPIAAQTSLNTDSLRKVIRQYEKEKSDTLYHLALFQLMRYYTKNDIKEAIASCKQGLEYSKNKKIWYRIEWIYELAYIYEQIGAYPTVIRKRRTNRNI